ncbi:hypothetical protein HPB49_021083 [Dermacentor silvarum]|uniref:Uncharacterized protein n=1 Tax=Dermacentor silvarum TaxID=543639 RepID=A0ACB8CBB3_DERSI|nr:hypothetical protein HPB49_021083 [Dermacentor silvarum]
MGVDSLQLGTVKYPLRAYVAAPGDDVRGIIYNALYNQTEEIIQNMQALNKSSQYTITDTRPLSNTKSTLITFISVQTLPKQLNFYETLYVCHPFKAKVEACHNCRRAGHRVNLCPHPKSNRCPRCGVEHQLVQPPTCTARGASSGKRRTSRGPRSVRCGLTAPATSLHPPPAKWPW